MPAWWGGSWTGRRRGRRPRAVAQIDLRAPVRTRSAGTRRIPGMNDAFTLLRQATDLLLEEARAGNGVTVKDVRDYQRHQEWELVLALLMEIGDEYPVPLGCWLLPPRPAGGVRSVPARSARTRCRCDRPSGARWRSSRRCRPGRWSAVRCRRTGPRPPAARGPFRPTGASWSGTPHRHDHAQGAAPAAAAAGT